MTLMLPAQGEIGERDEMPRISPLNDSAEHRVRARPAAGRMPADWFSRLVMGEASPFESK